MQREGFLLAQFTGGSASMGELSFQASGGAPSALASYLAEGGRSEHYGVLRGACLEGCFLVAFRGIP